MDTARSVEVPADDQFGLRVDAGSPASRGRRVFGLESVDFAARRAYERDVIAGPAGEGDATARSVIGQTHDPGRTCSGDVELGNHASDAYEAMLRRVLITEGSGEVAIVIDGIEPGVAVFDF